MRRYEKPAHRSPNCMKKTRNTFCGTRVSVLVPKFCKNCFFTQNFTEIGQSAAKLWSKNDFQYDGRPPSWILKNFITWLSPSSNLLCSCSPNFIKIGLFFIEIWRFDDFQDCARTPLSLWNLEFIVGYIILYFFFLLQFGFSERRLLYHLRYTFHGAQLLIIDSHKAYLCTYKCMEANRFNEALHLTALPRGHQQCLPLRYINCCNTEALILC